MSSVFGGAIVTGLQKLEQALVALDPAPNDQTMQLDDTILLKHAATPDMTNTMDSTSIHINDNTSTFFSVNESGLQFESTGGFNTQSSTEIQVEDASGNRTTIAPLHIELIVDGGPTGQQMSVSETVFYDETVMLGAECGVGTSYQGGVNGLKVMTGTQVGQNREAMIGFSGDETTPLMQLRNDVINNVVRIQTDSFVVNSDVQECFRFSNNHHFMKWDAGTSFRIDVNDSHVLADMAFKVSEGNPFDLEPYPTYLDNFGQAGWSVLLSNASGADINVTSPDCQFYSHPNGWTGSPFQLKKYATARFTLVPITTTSPGFAWAVSMY